MEDSISNHIEFSYNGTTEMCGQQFHQYACVTSVLAPSNMLYVIVFVIPRRILFRSVISLQYPSCRQQLQQWTNGSAAARNIRASAVNLKWKKSIQIDLRYMFLINKFRKNGPL